MSRHTAADTSQVIPHTRGEPNNTPETPSMDPTERILRTLPITRRQFNTKYASGSQNYRQSATLATEESVGEWNSRKYVHNKACDEKLKAKDKRTVTFDRILPHLDDGTSEMEQSNLSIKPLRMGRASQQHSQG